MLLQTFRTLASEFSDLNDDTIQIWFDLTSPLISKKVFGQLYDQALVLLTAHRLKMAGYGNTTYGTVGETLRISSYSEGGASIGFTPSQSNFSSANLELTTYGKQYAELRRLVVIPIRSAGEGR